MNTAWRSQKQLAEALAVALAPYPYWRRAVQTSELRRELRGKPRSTVSRADVAHVQALAAAGLDPLQATAVGIASTPQAPEAYSALRRIKTALEIVILGERSRAARHGFTRSPAPGCTTEEESAAYLASARLFRALLREIAGGSPVWPDDRTCAETVARAFEARDVEGFRYVVLRDPGPGALGLTQPLDDRQLELFLELTDGGLSALDAEAVVTRGLSFAAG